MSHSKVSFRFSIPLIVMILVINKKGALESNPKRRCLCDVVYTKKTLVNIFCEKNFKFFVWSDEFICMAFCRDKG